MKLSEKTAKQAFERLNSIPVDYWDDVELEDLEPDDEEIVEAIAPDELSADMKTMTRMAHKYDREIFIKATVKDEIPPLVLSPEEMQVVRRGQTTDFHVCTVLAGHELGEQAR